MMTKLKRLIAPPVFDDAQETQQAQLLNFVTLSYLAFLLFGVIAGFLAADVDVTSAIGIIAERLGLFFIATITAQVLLRLRRVRAASYIYVIVMTFSFIVMVIFNGGVRSVAFPNAIMIVLVAGLIINARAAFTVTAIMIATSFIALVLETQGLLPDPIAPGTNPVDWLSISIVMLISTILLNLFIKGRDAATAEAAEANASLKEAGELLEHRVDERTQELALAAEIGQIVAQIRDLNDLTTTAVSLIRQRFNLYHAQLYIADAQQANLTLLASTGEAGKQMLATGHKLPINTASLNGQAAVGKQPVLVSDTAASADFKPHKLLPYTRSETAVPLIVDDNIIGVLDMQSDQANAFTEENLPVFVTLAGQLAVAIENSTLFTEQQRLAADLGKFKLGMERSTDAIFLTDKDGTITYVNDAFVNIYGYTKEEALGNTPRIIKSGLVPQEQYEYFWQTLLSGDIIAGEITNQTKEGNFLNIEGNNNPIIDESNQVIGFLSMHRDITERKQIEEKLVEEQERTRTILESISTPIVIARASDGVVIYLNEPSAQIIGIPREELMGQATPDFFYNAPDRQDYVDKLHQHGQMSNYTVLLKKGDGSPFWALLSGRVAQFQEELVTITSFVDITERQEALAAVKANEALMRTIIDSTPDWIFIKNTEHRYQLVNQAYADAMGLTTETFLGKNDLEIGFPEEIVKGNPEKGIRGFWADDREIMDKGKTKVIDEEPAVVDGESRFLNTIKVPLQDNEGNVTGIVGFVHDITAIKQAEAIMAKQADELQTVAEISTAVSSTLDTKQLLLDIVNLTQKRFGLYHAHIYLLDKSSNTLKLTVGSGEVGTQMVTQGHTIPFGNKKSIVAQTARLKEGIIVNNVADDPAFLPNPLLPDTKSEMAVPMMVGNSILGVLDIQANEVDYFTDTDVNIQTTLATQIAVALENAHAFEQAREQATVIENTTSLIATASLNQSIQYINKAGIERLGYSSAEEILGNDLSMLFPSENAEKHRASSMQAVQEHGFWRGESMLITASGEHVPVDQSITLVHDENGTPKTILFNMTDITEQKQAEKSQQALNAELEAQLERVNALQSAMTRENWKAFMTATAGKRAIQGFEFNQEGIKTLTAQDLTTGKNKDASSSAPNGNNEVITPVKIQDTTIGKIGVRNPDGTPISEEKRNLLISLTAQVAEALDRARLFEETELGRQEIEEQAAELSTVNEISELVSTQLNINDLVNAVGDRLIETFAATSVYIALVDEKAKAISFPYFTNVIDGPVNIPPGTLDNKGGFTAKVYQTRQPIIHNPTDKNSASATVSGGGVVVDGSPDTNSYIGVPMIVGEQIIGVIGINGQQDRRMYDEEDVPLLTTLASTIAVALQNTQQFEATQRRANREAMVNEISQKIQSASTIESAMQTAVAELGKALNLKRAVVKLNKSDENKTE